MPRQTIKIDNLLEILNDELSNYDECIDCRFHSIIPRIAQDNSGCNWSHANLRGHLAPTGPLMALSQPASACYPIAARVISKAREMYNVR
jgi:hypothetical protein